MALFAASCMSDSDDAKKPSRTLDSFGVFTVSLVPASSISAAYSTVVGRVYDGEVPSALAWTQVAQGGACKLYTPNAPFCNPACGSNASCVQNNVCKPYPKSIPVGQVTVSGLKTKAGASRFTMAPLLNTYQPAVGTELAYPPFAEDADVSLSAEGGDSIPAFSVSAKGIAPLAIQVDTFDLEPGKAIEVAWTPAARPSGSKVHALLDISHHGGTKGKIECETSDAGSLTIPAALLDQLKALGVAGFPQIEITREARGSSADVGVDLVIKSAVIRDLRIPGLVSCSADEDCPSGQTCQNDLRCK